MGNGVSLVRGSCLWVVIIEWSGSSDKAALDNGRHSDETTSDCAPIWPLQPQHHTKPRRKHMAYIHLAQSSAAEVVTEENMLHGPPYELHRLRVGGSSDVCVEDFFFVQYSFFETPVNVLSGFVLV